MLRDEIIARLQALPMEIYDAQTAAVVAKLALRHAQEMLDDAEARHRLSEAIATLKNEGERNATIRLATDPLRGEVFQCTQTDLYSTARLERLRAEFVALRTIARLLSAEGGAE